MGFVQFDFLDTIVLYYNRLLFDDPFLRFTILQAMIEKYILIPDRKFFKNACYELDLDATIPQL